MRVCGACQVAWEEGRLLLNQGRLCYFAGCFAVVRFIRRLCVLDCGQFCGHPFIKMAHFQTSKNNKKHR
jgi:hypothetical protein